MEANEKACPHCAETVKAEAKVCKHCGYNFETGTAGAGATPAAKPKKGNKALGCVGLFVLIIIVLAVIGSMADSPDEAGVEGAGAAAADAPALKVTSRELAAAFEANEVAAKQQYGGQALEVTGTVQGVTLDFADDPVLQLEGSNQFLPVQAGFGKDASSALAAVSKGSKATVRCRELTEVISAPMLSDCELL